MSDETNATGERRRRWRLRSVAARFLWPSPSAILRLLRGIQSAPTAGDVIAGTGGRQPFRSTARPSPGEALGAHYVGSIENGQLCECGCQGPCSLLVSRTQRPLGLIIRRAKDYRRKTGIPAVGRGGRNKRYRTGALRPHPAGFRRNPSNQARSSSAN
jgi:hypothetical protein